MALNSRDTPLGSKAEIWRVEQSSDTSGTEASRKTPLAAERSAEYPAIKTSTTGASRASITARLSEGCNKLSPDVQVEIRNIIKEEFGLLRNNSDLEASQEKHDLAAAPQLVSPTTCSAMKHGQTGVAETGDTHSTRDPDGAPDSSSGEGSSKRRNRVHFIDLTRAESTPSHSDTTSPLMSVSPTELTAIDKKWGVLFDTQGAPTPRLRQVLGGLADYIVQEFMPQKSIIVTPDKMCTFYSHYKLDTEIFPFTGIFRGRSKEAYQTMAHLYLDLGCAYHLVQQDAKSLPVVPGLTPDGFTDWMIANMRAFPDEESTRWERVFSALPINAESLLDGKPERLPKQISRYLLPAKPDRKARRLLQEAMEDAMEDMSFPLPTKCSIPSPTSPSLRLDTAVANGRSPATTTAGSATPLTRARYLPPTMQKLSKTEPSSSQPQYTLEKEQNVYDRRQLRSHVTSPRDVAYSKGTTKTSYDPNTAARRDREPLAADPGRLVRTTSDQTPSPSVRREGIRPPYGTMTSSPLLATHTRSDHRNGRATSPPPTSSHRHSVAGISGGGDDGGSVLYTAAGQVPARELTGPVRERERGRDAECVTASVVAAATRAGQDYAPSISGSSTSAPSSRRSGPRKDGVVPPKRDLATVHDDRLGKDGGSTRMTRSDIARARTGRYLRTALPKGPSALYGQERRSSAFY